MRHAIIASLALLTACGGGKPKAETTGCDLGFDTLGGRTFVMLEAKDQNTEVQNIQARVKFEQRGDKLVAMYTAKSAINTYEYTCGEGKRADELECKTELYTDRLCRTLEVQNEGGCTVDALKEFGPSQSGEELAKLVEAETKKVAEARKSDNWRAFRVANHNVANVVQGVVLVSVREKQCDIKLTDMFMTHANGKALRDMNPVGRNTFVPVQDDLLFADCTDEKWLLDLSTKEVPKDLNTVPNPRQYTAGQDVYFHYLEPAALKPEEGCEYSYDTYSSYIARDKGVNVELTADGNLDWTAGTKFDSEQLIPTGRGAKGGVFHMVRYKTCGGKKEVLNVPCNVVTVE